MSGEVSGEAAWAGVGAGDEEEDLRRERAVMIVEYKKFLNKDIFEMQKQALGCCGHPVPAFLHPSPDDLRKLSFPQSSTRFTRR